MMIPALTLLATLASAVPDQFGQDKGRRDLPPKISEIAPRSDAEIVYGPKNEALQVVIDTPGALLYATTAGSEGPRKWFLRFRWEMPGEKPQLTPLEEVFSESGGVLPYPTNPVILTGKSIRVTGVGFEIRKIARPGDSKQGVIALKSVKEFTGEKSPPGTCAGPIAYWGMTEAKALKICRADAAD